MHAGTIRNLLHGMCVCAEDNPLAKACGLSSHTDALIQIQIVSFNCTNCIFEGSPIRYNRKFPAQSSSVSIYSYEVLCSVESDLGVNRLQSRNGCTITSKNYTSKHFENLILLRTKR